MFHNDVKINAIVNQADQINQVCRHMYDHSFDVELAIFMFTYKHLHPSARVKLCQASTNLNPDQHLVCYPPVFAGYGLVDFCN